MLDLVELMNASISGEIAKRKVLWDRRTCVSVVLASGGYPGSYEKGKPITGLDYFKAHKDAIVFHAGTTLKGNNVLTDGGRVLNVVGLGDSIGDAIDKAYGACDNVKFEKAHYRRDIGQRALNKQGVRA